MVGQDGLFDTNILIDHLNGLPQARTALDRYANRAISVIAWMEVLAGTGPLNEAATRSFLKAFTVLSISPDIAERAAKIRRIGKLKLPDAIILATAEIEDCTLVTRNTRDFDPRHPSIDVPYIL